MTTDHAKRLEEDGYTIVEDAIEPELVDELAGSLRNLETFLDVQPAGNSFEGVQTLRVYNLLAYDRVWERVPVHPSVLPVVEGVLDPGCLISSLSSITILPGETAQPIHADDQLLPIPKPHVPTVCNSMWALTDFTDANGATRLVPGSHHYDHSPDYGKPYDTIAAEMPKGSVLIWHGSLWHGGGANTTAEARVGIAMNYCAGFIRQQENQQLGIPREVAARFEPRLRELVGYSVYNALVGHINKHNPVEMLDAVSADGREDSSLSMVWDALPQVTADETSGHGTRRAIFAAFLANLGIAIAKFGAFLVTGSTSMMAESIHSVADTGNQGLLFLGGARSRRPADQQHQFGYGSERYFYAFVVALVLFSLGAMFSLYEGVEKLIHPHELESPAVAFVVLGIAVVLESFSLRTAVHESQPSRGDLSWWQFIRHTKTPELPVVLLEDIGALCGLVFAIIGLGLATATGETRYDAIGSIAIGLLLAVIAVVLAVEMKSLLIGESAEPDVDGRIRTAIESGPEVRRIIHLRTLHLGPDDLLVATKLHINAPSIAELATAVDAIEARIRAAIPDAKVVYIEPDLYRDPNAAQSS